MGAELYLDFNGSTPVDPEVRRAWNAWSDSGFGNASAAHPAGSEAREAIDLARARIARALGAEPAEIRFTSGGTESNNWALLGAARADRLEHGGRCGHLVVSAIEHKSVLMSAQHLESEGWSVSVVAPARSGEVRVADLRDAMREDTFLVALMLANNETGVLQPVAELSELCRRRGVLTHCDAVAAVGKVQLDVREIGCDLLSLSSHKLYAPKGCGLLYVRAGTRLEPLIHGCGQQDGMRSGTENTAGVIAFARAFERAESGAFRTREVELLRDALARGILERFPSALENGSGARLPNTLSVAFPGWAGADLQAALGREGISVSAGAAAGGGTPSHVLLAMGCGDERARSTLRFSLGAQTTGETIATVLAALERILVHARPVASLAQRSSR